MFVWSVCLSSSLLCKSKWQKDKSFVFLVALQLPEGLQMFACVIADIIERLVPIQFSFFLCTTYHTSEPLQ